MVFKMPNFTMKINVEIYLSNVMGESLNRLYNLLPGNDSQENMTLLVLSTGVRGGGLKYDIATI